MPIRTALWQVGTKPRQLSESRPPDMGLLSGVTNSALDGVAQA